MNELSRNIQKRFNDIQYEMSRHDPENTLMSFISDINKLEFNKLRFEIKMMTCYVVRKNHSPFRNAIYVSLLDKMFSK